MEETNLDQISYSDYCDAVEVLIKAEDGKISNQIFNVGYQNLSINEIAQKVKAVVQKEFPEKEKFQYIERE